MADRGAPAIHPDWRLLILILILVLAFQPGPVDQIEQQECHERESKYGQVGIDVPQIGEYNTAVVGKSGDLRENLLVGHAKENCTGQETEQTRNNVV